MKFSDILLLEGNQKFDSVRQKKINDFAETSIREKEIKEFLNKNLTLYFDDDEFFNTIKLIFDLTRLEPFLNRKRLTEYENLEDVKNTINQIRKYSLEFEKQNDIVKLYENKNYAVIYPKNFKSYSLYQWSQAEDNNQKLSEVDYESDNIYGRTFFIVPKNLDNDGFFSVFIPFDRDISEIKIKGRVKEYYKFKFLYEDAINAINEYMINAFSKYFNLFKDPYIRDKYIKFHEDLLEEKFLKQQESLRKNDVWFGTTIGDKANVALEYAKLYDDDSELNDIYDLYHYEGDYFSTKPKREGNVFRVMSKDEFDEVVLDFWKTYVNETELMQSYPDDVLGNAADVTKIKELFDSDYEDLIYNDPEDYFDSNEMLISSQDKEKIDLLNKQKKSLQDKLDNEEVDDDDMVTYQEQIDNIDETISDLEESAEKEVTDEMVEKKIKELWSDYSGNPLSYIIELGFEKFEYIDLEKLAKNLAEDEEQWGFASSSYDGEYDHQIFNNKEYFVIRVE